MVTVDIIHGIAVFSSDDGQVITTGNLKTIKNNAELTVFLEEMLMRPWFTEVRLFYCLFFELCYIV